MLVARHDWVEDNPGVVRALMRAAWRAARRLSTLAARITASELLSRPECLDLPAAHTDRAYRPRADRALRHRRERRGAEPAKAS